jgi:hypothetical protein
VLSSSRILLIYSGFFGFWVLVSSCEGGSEDGNEDGCEGGNETGVRTRVLTVRDRAVLLLVLCAGR